MIAYQSGAGQLDPDLTETMRLAMAEDWLAVLQWIVQLPPEDHTQQQFVARTLALFLEQVRYPGRVAEFQPIIPSVAEAYQLLQGRLPTNYMLLQWLAQAGGPVGLGHFAELLVLAPPTDAAQVAMACSPLVQSERRADLEQLFPRLLDGIAHLSAAAVIMDLANFAMRTGVVDTHPAWPRREQLAEMLGRLSLQLERLDEQRIGSGQSPEEQRQLVGECVSLAVTLCDALALFGETRFIGKLYQAFELRHRRIRTEAAFALARLGESAGRQALLELASDPSSRLRVLSYADELEITDEIPPEFQTVVARAESALALWLAEPAQMGVPPSRLELIDQSEMFWPGFQEPVECFLFRFTYDLATGEYSNIGIAGPATHATRANLLHLSSDDIYALFAGWQAEHEEIFECEVRLLSEPSQRDARRLEQLLRAEGYRDIEPAWMGFFFGEKALVVRARYDDQSGIAVADDERIEWWPATGSGQPLGPEDAFSIYKGRRLLTAFNE